MYRQSSISPKSLPCAIPTKILKQAIFTGQIPLQIARGCLNPCFDTVLRKILIDMRKMVNSDFKRVDIDLCTVSKKTNKQKTNCLHESLCESPTSNSASNW